MITDNLGGLVIFTEALAKTLIRKGVFEKSELVHQLELIRDGKDAKVPTEHGPVAGEIDKMITRVNNI